ncbi:MAG TPA: GNVR domain-containing protein [Rhodocyclaceae bacterium]|nr:GNVR domain-containing protein [Rhodocyclaceae bacterium]
MEEIISKLIGVLRGMWRYRWWGLITAWVVAIVGGVVIYKMPDKYESTARVFVDTQSVLRPLMSGLAVQPNVDQQIAILSRTLISRPNVEKLITMADLDLQATTSVEREALIASLTKGLRIRTTGRDKIFTLAYQDSDAARAQRVVQALLSLFVESGLVGKRQDSDAARKFIEDQIASYETRLAEAENRLKDFRLRNMALMGEGGDYISQIGATSQQLAQARLELQEAETSRTVLQRQLVGEEPVLLPQHNMASSVSIPELDGRIEVLRKNLDSLLLRYTEQHPEVLSVSRLLKELEGQKAAEVERMMSSGAAQFASLDANPVYQQMKLAHADAESRVAALQARVAEYERRLAVMREKAELVPKLEAEQAQLNRDYDVQKRNYEQLVSRRESASMSVEMSAQSGIADFRVIDPPSLATKPSAPNRILLVPLAGLAALGAGIALMFLLAQLRPTIMDGGMLREVTGLPVLGVVSFQRDPAVVRAARYKTIAFALILLMYLAALGASALALHLLQR